MPINVLKLKKELSKGSALEQYKALTELRLFVLDSLSSAQSQLQQNIDGIQNLINEVGVVARPEN